jgi:hypothetical protein
MVGFFPRVRGGGERAQWGPTASWKLCHLDLHPDVTSCTREPVRTAWGRKQRPLWLWYLRPGWLPSRMATCSTNGLPAEVRAMPSPPGFVFYPGPASLSSWLSHASAHTLSRRQCLRLGPGHPRVGAGHLQGLNFHFQRPQSLRSELPTAPKPVPGVTVAVPLGWGFCEFS